jgi:hypothetical protein
MLTMKIYTVYVDDNFHHGDENERIKLGDFDTREKALAACIEVVERYFEIIDKGKYSYDELWQGYMTYGEDPFISNDDEGCHFSAWDYAKKRCAEYAK